MLKIEWAKIDKFVLVLVAILIAMSFVVILTFRAIFSSYFSAHEITQVNIDDDFKINETLLEGANAWVFEKDIDVLKTEKL